MRYNLTIFLLSLCCALCAQTTMPTHKQLMVNYINTGEFDKAEKELNLVESWTFSIDDDFGKLDFQKAIEFVELVDSAQLAEGVQDSIFLYLAEHALYYGKYFMLQGNYDAAYSYIATMCNIKGHLYGENSPEYADALLNMALLLQRMGYMSDAERHFIHVADIFLSAYGEISDNYAQALTGLGLYYEEIGNYTKAELYLGKVLEIDKSLYGDNYAAYPATINNVGLLYMSIGNLTVAEQYLLIAADIFEKSDTKLSWANVLTNLGQLYLRKNDYDKAEFYYTKAWEASSFMGKESADYIRYLSHMAVVYKERLDYDKAIQLLKESAELAKKVSGEQNSDYAEIIRELGIIYVATHEYDLAEQYLTQTAEIFKSIYGEKHKMYAKCLTNIGWVYQKRGKYKIAESYYNAAYSIFASLENSHDKQLCIAEILGHYGSLHDAKGQYLLAKQYYTEELNQLLTVSSEEDPIVVDAMCDLGWAEVKLGEYQEAEKNLLKGLNAHLHRYGELSNPYVHLLRMVGVFYTSIGDYQKAEQSLQKAMELTTTIAGSQTLGYASSLSDMGVLKLYSGRYEEAEQVISQSIAIEKSIRGEKYHGNPNDLNNLGITYANLGDLKKAEYYLSLSNQEHRKRVGKQDFFDCSYYNNLGYAYLKNNKYNQAIKYLSKAETIVSSNAGFADFDRAKTLNHLGDAYFGKNDKKTARRYYIEANSILKQNYQQTLSFMSERQRSNYWQTIEQVFTNTYAPFAYDYYQSNPSISAFSYDNELFTKGLLLNSTTSIQRAILSSNDPTLIQKWKELEELRQQILSIQQQQSGLDIAQYEQEAEQLEKEITKASAAYRDNIRQWNITWDSVRNHLTSDQLAIEFMSVPLSEDSTVYCALLLRKNSKYPELIPLFEEKEALSMWDMSDDWSTNDMYSEDTNGRKFSKLVWSKLLPYIKKGETVYFAATGILHQLAIEALPYDENHSMADMFNLVRVSSTREIVTRHDHSDNTTAVLYGGIQYDVTADTLLAQSQQYATMSLLASRGIDNDTTNRGTVDYLPGTKIEADSIQQILEKSNVQVQLFTSTNANEESFKALSGTHQNILHIGTHGFFWTDSTAQKKDYFSQRMIGMDNAMSAPPTIDPLNRCGLLFAGANLAMQGHSADLPEGVQDGILTAKEISLLDLRDADLVVLSACETGKGEITGDGVFGLQRAFKMAGARTIIMSLWPVSDQATQLFMTEFFRHWITDGLPKRAAFRKAQNQVRQAYGEPIYWAGFIMLD